MNMVAALPRVAPLLARHALGYAELATEELTAAGMRLRQRALAMMLCAGAAGMAVLMSSLLAIAVFWDTSHRLTVIAGLLLICVTAAVIAGEVARRLRQKHLQLFPRLRNEWTTDRELLREALATRETGS
jgi:uncharacterized membrane protein YqjE